MLQKTVRSRRSAVTEGAAHSSVRALLSGRGKLTKAYIWGPISSLGRVPKRNAQIGLTRQDCPQIEQN